MWLVLELSQGGAHEKVCGSKLPKQSLVFIVYYLLGYQYLVFIIHCRSSLLGK